MIIFSGVGLTKNTIFIFYSDNGGNVHSNVPGDQKIAKIKPGHPRYAQIEDWTSHGSGKLGIRDCREISYASAALGGLRDGNGTPPDPIVGIEWLARAGDEVTAGQVLARIHHRDGRGLKEARARLSQAIDLENPVMPLPLIMGRLDP